MTIERMINDTKYVFELTKEELGKAFKERLHINHQEDLITTLEKECSYLNEKEKDKIISCINRLRIYAKKIY